MQLEDIVWTTTNINSPVLRHQNSQPFKSLFTIHPEYTEYIPLHYLSSWLYSPTSIEDFTPQCNAVPVMYLDSYVSNVSETFYSISRNHRHKYYLSGYDTIIGGKGIHFHKEQLSGCVAVKSSFVRSIFDKYFDFLFNDSKTFKIYATNNFLDDTSLFDNICHILSAQWFIENLDGQDLRNNCKIIINRDVTFRYSNILSFYSSSMFNGIPTMNDSLTDYFHSLLFTTIEKPKFEDIDGPEKLVLELAQEL